MPRSFAITAASNSLFLDEDRKGEARFTVSNQSGRPIRGRARLVTEKAEADSWVALGGEAEREFAIAGTEQYTVDIDVPPDAPRGNYTVRLDMVGEERPDEQYVEGPAVTFQVPEAEPKSQPFPWKILAAVATVLLLGGLIILFWPQTGTTHETLMVEPDPALSEHYWRSQGGGSQFVDLNRYNYRAGVSRQEDLPPAGESLSILTFPVRGLSSDNTRFASLQVGPANVVGDPFASLGNLLIEEVSFADLSMAPHTLTPLNELFRLDRPPIQPENGVGDALDITEILQAALERGSQRFQIRLRFEDVELEDIDAEIAAPTSYVEWDQVDVHLRITVLVSDG